MRILHFCVVSLLTLGVRHHIRIPSLFDYYSSRHSHSLMFLQLWTALS